MGILNNFLDSFGYTRYSDGSTWTTSKGNTSFGGGTDKLQLALCNPVLSAVFNIRANYLSKVKFYVLEKDGTKNFDDSMLDLIKNPNRFQSQEDFIKQYEWLRCAYGWVYQKPFGGIGADPTAIYNLKPSKIDFPTNMGDAMLWDDSDLDNYFDKKFTYTDVDTKKPIAFADIIPFFDIANGLTDCDTSSMTSPSRIDSIIKQIANIGLAADAENVVIQTNGREMIFADDSGNSSKQFGNESAPIGKDNKDDIQNKLNSKYLMRSGRSRTLTPDKKLAWVNMSIKAGDLGLHESITSNSSLVTQQYGITNEIYQSYKTGSTFENQAQAEVKFYQNVMQPVADDLASSWTTKFGDSERPFGASFEHLPMMQDVEDKKSDKVTKIAKAFKDLTSAGMTTEQAIAMMQSLGVDVEITKTK